MILGIDKLIIKVRCDEMETLGCHIGNKRSLI